MAIVAVASGYALYTKAYSARTASTEALAQLRKAPLRDLSGNSRRLEEWTHQALVVNFWATWCEPCREEVPALVRTQSKFAANGLAIVGIAIDSADKVRDFGKEYGVNYTLLLGALETVDLVRGLGNRAGGLPFTLVMSKGGRLVTAHLGAISEADLERAVRRALE
ncbi:MAG: TlpA family protein disulfide reductase [Betaproteobacteria bacterium]|nr:TlpA family protein disulfide reductase [Betaproteobacteria bacterium]MBI2961205.1 TlpA family protein disulfide reductase [Betaproteobacteria bacterium]